MLLAFFTSVLQEPKNHLAFRNRQRTIFGD